MKKLLLALQQLKKSPLHSTVEARLAEFSSFVHKADSVWFSELCFCILVANAKFSTGFQIQQTLGYNGFITLPEEKLAAQIRLHKHRFHNTKAHYICQARGYTNIKSILTDLIPNHSRKNEEIARQWLVRHIKGIGYKEASHFLRNTGSTHLAIVDRHIVNVLFRYRILLEKPKSITPKIYLEIEEKLEQLGKQIHMHQAELDLYLWSMQTGQVLK